MKLTADQLDPVIPRKSYPLNNSVLCRSRTAFALVGYNDCAEEVT